MLCAQCCAFALLQLCCCRTAPHHSAATAAPAAAALRLPGSRTPLMLLCCRVVLAACLHALKSPGEPNFAVASRFLSQRLLAAPGVAAAAAASPAGPADSSGDEVMQDASDSGAAAGGVAAAPAAAAAVVAGMLPADAQQQGGGQAEQPLAARVLGGLAAKDQAWVRSHVEKWSKGGWACSNSCFVHAAADLHCSLQVVWLNNLHRGALSATAIPVHWKRLQVLCGSSVAAPCPLAHLQKWTPRAAWKHWAC